MTITPLFAFVMVVSSGLAAFSWRHHRLHKEPRTQRGPVPGYSMTAGAEVKFPDAAFEGYPKWSVISLEEFHSPNRARLVFRLLALEDGDFTEVASKVALDGQARAHSHVVLVEVLDKNGNKLTRHLYSPDGQGWSGAEAIQHLSD